MSTGDNYEAAASNSATDVARFDETSSGFVGKIHHALHVTPALVPLIVLLASIVVFGLLLGSKFFRLSR